MWCGPFMFIFTRSVLSSVLHVLFISFISVLLFRLLYQSGIITSVISTIYCNLFYHPLCKLYSCFVLSKHFVNPVFKSAIQIKWILLLLLNSLSCTSINDKTQIIIKNVCSQSFILTSYLARKFWTGKVQPLGSMKVLNKFYAICSLEYILYIFNLTLAGWWCKKRCHGITWVFILWGTWKSIVDCVLKIIGSEPTGWTDELSDQYNHPYALLLAEQKTAITLGRETLNEKRLNYVSFFSQIVEW